MTYRKENLVIYSYFVLYVSIVYFSHVLLFKKKRQKNRAYSKFDRKNYIRLTCLCWRWSVCGVGRCTYCQDHTRVQAQCCRSRYQHEPSTQLWIKIPHVELSKEEIDMWETLCCSVKKYCPVLFYSSKSLSLLQTMIRYKCSLWTNCSHRNWCKVMQDMLGISLKTLVDKWGILHNGLHSMYSFCFMLYEQNEGK